MKRHDTETLGGALITSVGNGAWYTSWAAFLTRSLGLSPAEVGLGMTLAGGAGILAATPLGVLSLCWWMLSSGVPLWVALHTDAPRPVSAAIVLPNSLAIAAFQVRVSQGIRSPLGAARAARCGPGARRCWPRC